MEDTRDGPLPTKLRNERYGGGEFASLDEVVDAHKRFYHQERARTLWPRLSERFARVEAALARAKN